MVEKIHCTLPFKRLRSAAQGCKGVSCQSEVIASLLNWNERNRCEMKEGEDGVWEKEIRGTLWTTEPHCLLSVLLLPFLFWISFCFCRFLGAAIPQWWHDTHDLSSTGNCFTIQTPTLPCYSTNFDVRFKGSYVRKYTYYYCRMTVFTWTSALGGEEDPGSGGWGIGTAATVVPGWSSGWGCWQTSP